MCEYDSINREERYLCSHLFRLLHEKIEEGPNSPLGKVLELLSKCKFPNGKFNSNDLHFKNVGIFCEVSLIRDVYFSKKPDEKKELVDKLVEFLMAHYGIDRDCRNYSQLLIELNDCLKPHPVQIIMKADKKTIYLSANEQIIYKAVKELFCAKPDLLITVDNKLVVFEAKFTQPFKRGQFELTRLIAEIWSNLFYKYLGYESIPEYLVCKLGRLQSETDITWNDIEEIARKTYSEKENDRTAIALTNSTKILTK
jgi:hypothetical protein